MKDVLFITWDGPESPYLATLFLPIFQGLSDYGYRFHVLQFTWASKAHVHVQEQAAADAGVRYSSIPVLRGPAIVSAVAMISAGVIAVRRYLRQHAVHVAMPRSIMPGAMALRALRGSPTKLVFEADGLAADERVDFAGWSASGATYRIWREIEAQAVRTADSVLTRTKASMDILLARAGAGTDAAKFFVVPNARDPAQFHPGNPDERMAVRTEWGVHTSDPCLLFAGSLGPQYYPDRMIELHRRMLRRHSNSQLVLLTSNVEMARATVTRAGVDQRRVTIRSVPAASMPRQIAAADLGLALRAPTFSQRAVSPIKVSEYLLCGVPVLSTAVGDLPSQLTADVALFVNAAEDAELERAANWIGDVVLSRREAMRGQCRKVGLKEFSLDTAVRRYAAALNHAATDTD